LVVGASIALVLGGCVQPFTAGPGAGGATGTGAAGGSSGSGGSPPTCSSSTDLSSDPQNCGKCGYVCGNAPCVEGACEILAPSDWSFAVGDLTALAVDDSHVFWATDTSPNGQVFSLPKSGGKPVAIASGQFQPRGLALDATHVFWGNQNGGTIMQANKDGSSQMTIATAQQGPEGVATDGTWVYWADVSGGDVSKVHVGGGPVTIVFNVLTAPRYVAVNTHGLCWTSTTGNEVQCSLGGVAPVTIPNQPLARGIAADDTHFFWTNAGATPGTGQVVALTLGTMLPQVLAQNLASPWPIAVDPVGAHQVYFGNATEVDKVPVSGGNPDVLASKQQSVAAVALDKGSYYWIDTMAKAIYRAAR
jgi:hypothetical protein